MQKIPGSPRLHNFNVRVPERGSLGTRLFFMVKTLIFVVKTDFLMFRSTNFLVRSQNILVTKFLGQSPFHSNAKISYSTLFHSNFMLNSVPFQQHFMVSDSLDLPAPDVSHAFLLNFGVVCVFTGNSYNTSPTM